MHDISEDEKKIIFRLTAHLGKSIIDFIDQKNILDKLPEGSDPIILSSLTILLAECIVKSKFKNVNEFLMRFHSTILDLQEKELEKNNE